MMSLLDDARLYFVVEADASDRLLEAALGGGCNLLQLRDKEGDDETLLESAERFRDACDRYGALFVLNDRPELALQCGADGVHVGPDDLPVDAVRRLVGPEMLIGLSTHSPGQFDEVLGSPADYLSAGPIWQRAKSAAAGEVRTPAASEVRTAAPPRNKPGQSTSVTARNKPGQSTSVTAAKPPPRSELRNAEARAKLVPLREGERPVAVTVAA